MKLWEKDFLKQFGFVLMFGITMVLGMNMLKYIFKKEPFLKNFFGDILIIFIISVFYQLVTYYKKG